MTKRSGHITLVALSIIIGITLFATPVMAVNAYEMFTDAINGISRFFTFDWLTHNIVSFYKFVIFLITWIILNQVTTRIALFQDGGRAGTIIAGLIALMGVIMIPNNLIAGIASNFSGIITLMFLIGPIIGIIYLDQRYIAEAGLNPRVRHIVSFFLYLSLWVLVSNVYAHATGDFQSRGINVQEQDSRNYPYGSGRPGTPSLVAGGPTFMPPLVVGQGQTVTYAQASTAAATVAASDLTTREQNINDQIAALSTDPEANEAQINILKGQLAQIQAEKAKTQSLTKELNTFAGHQQNAETHAAEVARLDGEIEALKPAKEAADARVRETTAAKARLTERKTRLAAADPGNKYTAQQVQRHEEFNEDVLVMSQLLTAEHETQQFQDGMGMLFLSMPKAQRDEYIEAVAKNNNADDLGLDDVPKEDLRGGIASAVTMYTAQRLEDNADPATINTELQTMGINGKVVQRVYGKGDAATILQEQINEVATARSAGTIMVAYKGASSYAGSGVTAPPAAQSFSLTAAEASQLALVANADNRRTATKSSSPLDWYNPKYGSGDSRDSTREQAQFQMEFNRRVQDQGYLLFRTQDKEAIADIDQAIAQAERDRVEAVRKQTEVTTKRTPLVTQRTNALASLQTSINGMNGVSSLTGDPVASQKAAAQTNLRSYEEQVYGLETEQRFLRLVAADRELSDAEVEDFLIMYSMYNGQAAGCTNCGDQDVFAALSENPSVQSYLSRNRLSRESITVEEDRWFGSPPDDRSQDPDALHALLMKRDKRIIIGQLERGRNCEEALTYVNEDDAPALRTWCATEAVVKLPDPNWPPADLVALYPPTDFDRSNELQRVAVDEAGPKSWFVAEQSDNLLEDHERRVGDQQVLIQRTKEQISWYDSLIGALPNQRTSLGQVKDQYQIIYDRLLAKAPT